MVLLQEICHRIVRIMTSRMAKHDDMLYDKTVGG
jgi:hypothetical protein